MRIAFVNDTFLKGRGVDHVIFELASILGKKHEVDVLATVYDFEEKNFRAKVVKGGKLLTGGWGDFLFFRNWFSFRRVLKMGGYDIINLHHSTLNPGLLGLGNLVTTYHGSPFEHISEKGVRKFARRYINNVGKWSLRFDKKIISISDYLRSELVNFSIPRTKIVKITDGVDKEFTPTWKDKGYMLFVGRHEKHKKIEELIEVSKDFDFPLKIAGSGPETKNLENLTRKLKAPVEFPGRVDKKDLVKLYQNCSFFVSASKWEGFGLIFMEAAACGKPSVAYNVCAIPEVIIHGKTGYLAETRTIFRNFIKNLIESKNLRKELGKKAFEFSKKFSWDSVAKEYENLFLDLSPEKT